MKKEASKMTLEKLATMVAGSFARIEETMATKEEVNKGFKKVEKDLEVIRGELLKQHDKFVSQDVFNTRISAIEAKVKIKVK